jgi:hypothetical protein
MKPIKIMGLCLVAVFVMSVVAEGTASAALPDFVTCRKVKTVKTGQWKNEQCTEAQKEGEWTTRAGGSEGDETVSSTSGTGLLETTGGKKIECKSDRANGRIANSKEIAGLTTTFFECEEKSKKVPCNSVGHPGEIKTNIVKGRMGYIAKGPPAKVGLLLEPASGTKFVEFECTSTTKVKVEGSLIGEVGPLNVFGLIGTLSYKQTLGIQEPVQFENETTGHWLITTFTGPVVETSGLSTLSTPDQLEFNHDTEVQG